MSEFRKFSPTRQIIDLQHLSAYFGDSVVLCVPTSTWLVARNLLSTRGRWPTSYAVGYAGTNGYFIPDADDNDFKQLRAEIATFLGASDMTCDLVAAFEEINTSLQSIASNVCCGTGAGAGGAGAYETTPIDFTDDGSNYPGDFGSKSEYDMYRCDAAEWIIRLLEQDILFIQNTDVTAITAAILAASLVTPVPLDDLAALALLIAQLLVEATLDTVLQNIYDAIQSNRDDLRCTIYNAISPDDGKADIVAWFAGKVGVVEQSFVGYFINFDLVNNLFKKASAAVGINADCSLCGQCDNVVTNLGTDLGGGQWESVYQATATPRHIVQIRFNWDDDLSEYCGPTTTINSISVSSGAPNSVSGNEAYRVQNQSGQYIYQSDNPPSNLSGAATLIVLDNVSPPETFVINVDYG